MFGLLECIAGVARTILQEEGVTAVTGAAHEPQDPGPREQGALHLTVGAQQALKLGEQPDGVELPQEAVVMQAVPQLDDEATDEGGQLWETCWVGAGRGQTPPHPWAVGLRRHHLSLTGPGGIWLQGHKEHAAFQVSCFRCSRGQFDFGSTSDLTCLGLLLAWNLLEAQN